MSLRGASVPLGRQRRGNLVADRLAHTYGDEIALRL